MSAFFGTEDPDSKAAGVLVRLVVVEWAFCCVIALGSKTVLSAVTMTVVLPPWIVLSLTRILLVFTCPLMGVSEWTTCMLDYILI
jgi:hypothetical protein